MVEPIPLGLLYTDMRAEEREGKKYYDPGEKSPEMQKLNSSFGKLHGASSLSNVIGLAAMLSYGFILAQKL